MAGDLLRALPQRLGPLDAAAVEGKAAARVEGAAGRDRRQPRHRARNLHEALVFAGERRDRAHQALGIGMQRVAHHVLHRADLGDAAGIHHRDAVGGLRDHAHVVGHQHHGGAVVAAEPLDQRDDLRLHRHIERGGRLVGDDQLGLGADRERNDDALAHAAGEFVRIGVDAFFRRGNADFGEQVDGALARRLFRQIRVCVRMVSMICSPIRYSGLRLVSGSWKIMPMRLPRMRRISSGGRLSIRDPDSRISPPEMRPGGSISPIAASPVTDLPAPDSPTTPSTSPLAMSNDTPSMARSAPRRVTNSTCRLRTERTGTVIAVSD